jgi:hypothetical protein
VFSVILAGAAVPPVPPVPHGNVATWVTTADYPEASLRASQRGYVLFRLVVSPSGTVIRCETQGNTVMDRAFCRIAPQRAQFEPARDENGTAVHGIYRNRVRFILVGKTMPPAPLQEDLTLAVDRLPAQAPRPALSTVSLVISSDGQIAHCAPLGPAPSEIDRFLGRISCAELPGGLRPETLRDAAGLPVRYVETRTVMFEPKTR